MQISEKTKSYPVSYYLEIINILIHSFQRSKI